jgi:hypothetical protein
MFGRSFGTLPSSPRIERGTSSRTEPHWSNHPITARRITPCASRLARDSRGGRGLPLRRAWCPWGAGSPRSRSDALQHALDLHRLPLGPARRADAALVQRLCDPAERRGTGGPDLRDDRGKVSGSSCRFLDANRAADLAALVADGPQVTPVASELRAARLRGGQAALVRWLIISRSCSATAARM